MAANLRRPPRKGFRRWFNSGAWIALAIFIAGRIAVEPFRTLPRFDYKGMEAYAAVETFKLDKVPHDIDVGIFGSSVAVWGIVPEVVSNAMGFDRKDVRKLTVEGGTPFDMRNLIRHNPHRLDHMTVALVEINPRMLHENLEGDPRLSVDISEHATLWERQMISRDSTRRIQTAEWFLPLQSVRRPLMDAFLNVLNPDSGTPIMPGIDSRLRPFGDWYVPDPATATFSLKTEITPATTARRIIHRWEPSRLLDHSLRTFLEWVQGNGTIVYLFQTPVHPDVANEILARGEYRRMYRKYQEYVHSLGLPEDAFYETLDVSECGIPVAGLRDHTHLNQLGAEIYSRQLGERVRGYLAKRGVTANSVSKGN